MVSQSNQIGLYFTIPIYLGGMGFAAYKAWRLGKKRAKVRSADQRPLSLTVHAGCHARLWQ